MEKETGKLLNVLRRIARAAAYAEWNKSGADASRFCVSQYNKILARLTELEPTLKTLFTPLAEDTSPQVTRMAARELLAYFEADEPDFSWVYPRMFAFRCRPRRSQGSWSGCGPSTARC